MDVEYLGNKELLKLKKTAFLASSTISSETVLRCYDWTTEKAPNVNTPVFGEFTMTLECRIKQDKSETGRK